MKKVIHRADTRGHANYGWLDTYHTFSFFRYHDSKRMNFGLLRVLNDDVVQPGAGFGTHPHDNMEIISIPLQGALEHKDSTGHVEVISENDVQIMSAGSGVTHSEYNHSKSEQVNFLQIWVQPKKIDITPRYDQKTFPTSERKNQIQLIVSPEQKNNSLWINQNAYFSRADLNKNVGLKYQPQKKINGVYIFLIDGEIGLDSEVLNKRDGLGISGTDEFNITAREASQLLFIEIPMETTLT